MPHMLATAETSLATVYRVTATQQLRQMCDLKLLLKESKDALKPVSHLTRGVCKYESHSWLFPYNCGKPRSQSQSLVQPIEDHKCTFFIQLLQVNGWLLYWSIVTPHLEFVDQQHCKIKNNKLLLFIYVHACVIVVDVVGIQEKQQ